MRVRPKYNVGINPNRQNYDLFTSLSFLVVIKAIWYKMLYGKGKITLSGKKDLSERINQGNGHLAVAGSKL
jgi:hypothetical protein